MAHENLHGEVFVCCSHCRSNSPCARVIWENDMSEFLISIEIESLEEGGYLATSDDLQGLIAQGRTIAETMEIAQDVAKKIIESCIEHGDPLPSTVKLPKKQVQQVKIPISISI
jgi:antitoxin HicB